jgi:ABC-type amino acid transport system permease subunit
MRFTPYLILLAIAGALFAIAALNLDAGIPALDFVALGLVFVTAALVAEHMRGGR